MLKASKHETHPETRHHRTRIKDSFDRAGVYAQSFGDVFSPQLLIVHLTGSIVSIEPVATPFGELLGSSADEGRAKPRYYSV